MPTENRLSAWVRRNPLKLAGVIWLIGEGVAALAGGLELNNPVMVFGGLCGAVSCFIVLMWGRGGTPDAQPSGDGGVKVLTIREMFSIRKCLFGWRYPVEAAAFWGFLNGVAYAVSGLQQWHNAGRPDTDGVTMIIGGSLFVIGSVNANCVPDRPGKWSSMVKSAICYIAGDVFFIVAAWRMGSVLLGVSMVIFITSNVPWAISHRHDNKIKHEPLSHH